VYQDCVPVGFQSALPVNYVVSSYTYVELESILMEEHSKHLRLLTLLNVSKSRRETV